MTLSTLLNYLGDAALVVIIVATAAVCITIVAAAISGWRETATETVTLTPGEAHLYVRRRVKVPAKTAEALGLIAGKGDE